MKDIKQKVDILVEDGLGPVKNVSQESDGSTSSIKGNEGVHSRIAITKLEVETQTRSIFKTKKLIFPRRNLGPGQKHANELW